MGGKGTFINVCFFSHTIGFRAPRCGPLSPCHWLLDPIRADAANMLKEEKYLIELGATYAVRFGNGQSSKVHSNQTRSVEKRADAVGAQYEAD